MWNRIKEVWKGNTSVDHEIIKLAYPGVEGIYLLQLDSKEKNKLGGVGKVARWLDKQYGQEYIVLNYTLDQHVAEMFSKGNVQSFSSPFAEDLYTLLETCYYVHQWFREGHCKKCLIVTQLRAYDPAPLIAACLLLYQNKSMLETANSQRAWEIIKSRGVKVQDVYEPSFMRYVDWFGLLFSGHIPYEQPVQVAKLHLVSVPSWARESYDIDIQARDSSIGEWRSIFSINDADVPFTDGVIDLELHIQGDFMILYTVPLTDHNTGRVRKEPLFRFTFSTLFLPRCPAQLKVPRTILDFACTKPYQLVNADFHIVLNFVPENTLSMTEKDLGNSEAYVRCLADMVDRAPDDAEVVGDADDDYFSSEEEVANNTFDTEDADAFYCDDYDFCAVAEVEGVEYSDAIRELKQTLGECIDEMFQERTHDLLHRESSSFNKRPRRRRKTMSEEHIEGSPEGSHLGSRGNPARRSISEGTTDQELNAIFKEDTALKGSFRGAIGLQRTSPRGRKLHAKSPPEGGEITLQAPPPPPPLPKLAPPPPPGAPAPPGGAPVPPPPPGGKGVPPPPPGGKGVPPPPPPPGGKGVPPPPPGGKGIPPPPPGKGPPPPPGKGPPPPPGKGMPPPPTFGFKSANVSKMKTFHWKQVKQTHAETEGSIWTALAQKQESKGEAEIDLSLLQEMFEKKNHQKKKAVTKAEPVSNKSTAISDSRAQNIGIVLTFLKMPAEDIVAAILACDNERLTHDMLEGMQSIIPQDDEIKALIREKEKNPDVVWGTPEKFVALSGEKVPDLAERLRLWLFALDFAKVLDELTTGMTLFTNALVLLLDEQTQFGEVLKFILMIGNSMNEGTRHGGAVGFRMENLSQLSSVKSNDGQTSLMDFIVMSINGKNPELKNFTQELEPVSKARVVSISEVSKGVQELKTGSTAIKKRLALPVEEGDGFPAYLQEFISEAEAKIDALVEESNQVADQTSKLALFYGEDKIGFDPGEFFQQIIGFSQEFQAADKTFKERAERTKRKEAAEAKKLEQEQKKAAQKEEEERKAKRKAAMEEAQAARIDG